jgi:hypothetical protein
MTEEAFYRAEGDVYHPNPVSAGPWRADSLMGRVVVGLLGFEIERRYLEPDLIPARLTVELHRLPDFSPISIVTHVVRGGGRIRIVEAEFVSNGESMAKATCQLLRRTETPPGRVWTPSDWDAPPPEAIATPEAFANWKWSLRPIAGGVGHVGLKRMWMQDYRELVAGTPLTPFAQAALAADFVSPFSTIGDRGAGYINTDVTLYLQRLPEQGWVGFEVTDHQASAGVALGQCRLYDKLGPIGFAANAAIAQRRPEVVQPNAGPAMAPTAS